MKPLTEHFETKILNSEIVRFVVSNFNEITDLIVVVDKENLILAANQPYLDFVKLDSESVLGSKCFVINPRDTCVLENDSLKKTVDYTNGRKENFNAIFDSHHFSFTVNAVCMGDKQVGSIVIAKKMVLNQDFEEELFKTQVDLQAVNLELISQLDSEKKLSSLLEQARNEAEQASAAKSEFLASMSHEIRTPMNGIMGMLSLLKDMNLSEEQKEFVDVANKSSENLLSIINDILDISKIEADKLDLVNIDFDLRVTIDEICEMLALKAENKGINFAAMVSHEIPEIITGDPGRLKQVIINLANNALKFTHEGDVLIQMEQDSAEGNEIYIRFSISDTGIGISKEKVEEIFKPFTQADNSTTKKYDGTGLGLTISQQLVDMMGGKIEVFSAQNKGSTFTFTLRFGKQKNVRNYPKLNFKDVQNKKILVVDDYRFNRYILHEMLHKYDCKFEEAKNGNEALVKLKMAEKNKDPFNLAIIDMKMPDMDGRSLGKTIREDNSLNDVNLLMLTSVGKRGDAADIQKIGFSGYLTKPIKHKQLYSAIATVLQRDNLPEKEQEVPLVTKYYLKEIEKQNIQILLVEDNLINQKVALKMLEKNGYPVDVAVNGKLAVETFQKKPYDLILMDCQMPEMNGWEATRKIRELEKGKGPIIIAMTAYAMEGDRERCIQAGMNDYFTKPVQMKKMLNLIKKYFPEK